MLILITVQNGLPYCLLSEIDIVSLLKLSTHLSVLRHKITIYMYVTEKFSKSGIYNIYPGIARIIVLISAHVKTAVYQGVVM